MVWATANGWNSLAPKYEELASLYTDAPDLASKVTIAKIDATANDVPDSITGFPTIKLYPAGSKNSPVEYAGPRTVEDLVSFVKENGHHKVDALVKAQDGDDATENPSASSETEAPAATDDKADHDEL